LLLFPGEDTRTSPGKDEAMRDTDNRDPIGRLIGALIAVGGLWHAAAPWILGYSDVRTATGISVAAGLTLVVFGGLRAAAAGVWATAVCGVVGLWVLLAPQVFGYGGPGFAEDEAVWGGLMVGVLVILDMIARPALSTGPHGVRVAAG